MKRVNDIQAEMTTIKTLADCVEYSNTRMRSLDITRLLVAKERASQILNSRPSPRLTGSDETNLAIVSNNVKTAEFILFRLVGVGE